MPFRTCERCGTITNGPTYNNRTRHYRVVCGPCVRCLSSDNPLHRIRFGWFIYDLWIGAYYDKLRKRWYFCPLPTLAFSYDRRTKGLSETEALSGLERTDTTGKA